MSVSRLLVVAPLVLLPGVALAHPGHATDGLVLGLSHPLIGLDHLLAMLAVGAWVAITPMTRRWRLPAAFAAAMSGGALIGITGLPLPEVEMLIALSLLILASLMLLRRPLSPTLACALAGGLALVHGYAHGRELPADADTVTAAAWLFGMLVATGLLQAAGAALAMASRRHPTILKGAAAAIAVAGTHLLLAP
jgi:urease accessory protein